MSYTYSVTAEDTGGNESEEVETDLVSLGPPPTGGKPEVPEGAEVVKVATVQLGGELPDEEDQADFIADIRQVLADLLGVDISRINVTGLRPGSIIIDFEIVEDEEDEVSAEELVADLTEALDENPDAFSAVEGAGAVESVVITNAVAVDFGALSIDGEASEEFIFVNSADDADAILSVSAEVSGDGYSVSPANFNLAVGEEGSFDVSFDASDVDNINGDYSGVLEIRTNDPNQRFTTVA
jgi:phenylpyruvate tautomerase PptA (4-oxalocrotonate tautomerase family)